MLFFTSREVDYVLIGEIHDRKPTSVNALAEYPECLFELGKTKNILLQPILKPWEYFNNIRDVTEEQSVSDSDHLLGRAEKSACKACSKIINFVVNEIEINKNAKVLDLHEDPVYEANHYVFEGYGSYLYAAGKNAEFKDEVIRIADFLRKSELPLIDNGVTRFEETISNGVIINSEDGSIDELLAVKCKAAPVITVENLLHGETDPELGLRVKTYIGILNTFFNIS